MNIDPKAAMAINMIAPAGHNHPPSAIEAAPEEI